MFTKTQTCLPSKAKPSRARYGLKPVTGTFLFRRSLQSVPDLVGTFLLLPSVVVQVFVRAVKTGSVDHFGRRQNIGQTGQCLAAGFVVVEEGMDEFVLCKERQGFGQIDDGVQDEGINRRVRSLLERKIRKKIQSLKKKNRNPEDNIEKKHARKIRERRMQNEQ